MADTRIRIERVRLHLPAMERGAAARLAAGLGPAIAERVGPSVVGATPGHAWVARVDVPPIRSTATESTAFRASLADAVASSVTAKLPGRRSRP